MGEYNKATTAPIKDNVTTRLESLLGRLEKANHRLSGVVDRILGPTPRPAEDQDKFTHDCLRRGVDQAHQLVSAYESELDRLGDSL